MPDYYQLEKRLWDAADQLRANSKLKPSEYSLPVLGLIFLRYADYKFTQALQRYHTSDRPVAERERERVLSIPLQARFESLLNRPTEANLGEELNSAMRAIEAENPALKNILPKTYHRLSNEILRQLLTDFHTIALDIEGDAFGRIYEYFLSNFAMSEGQKGGEFFTPTSLVKLIVEIIEPYHGRIFDPACGSGGMFVQSASFVEKRQKNPSTDIGIYGQEKIADNVRLCLMNLAIHGLTGDIRQSNTYYEDIHDCVGKFDFVMANPPFNVDKVDKEKIKNDPRFPLGLPRVDNANYLWIQLFYSALNAKGRAGFVMANSASDARGLELEIRKKLIHEGVLEAIVAVGSHFFYTVGLPCTLWFFDRAKVNNPRKDKVLFIDARQFYQHVYRSHRQFSDEQIQFLGNIVRMYRGQSVESVATLPEHTRYNPAVPAYGTLPNWEETFPNNIYRDVPGLCRISLISEIAEQSYSLNPGRYVGIAPQPEEDVNFQEKLQELHDEFEMLTVEARELEGRISKTIDRFLKVKGNE
ncbi:type I restriction-modification system subunit M [Laspinema sp. D1]|uniref:site-specific DNA-methyltransferase (adenine-specific) n=1 Tax=Laspinema palackyanum D2a TaxID=2953684 RepID=A0ABT2MJN2_9CYAN|nr:type I restriction-modification system subunit M [Laspinema sp. D2a]